MNIDISALELADAGKTSGAARKFAPKAKPRPSQVHNATEVPLDPSLGQQLEEGSKQPSHEPKQGNELATEKPKAPVAAPRAPSQGLMLLNRLLNRPEKAKEARPAAPSRDIVAQEPAPADEEDQTEPEEDPAWSSESEERPKKRRKATGRVNKKVQKKMTTEQLAHMELDAGRDSISKFVQRANAQERLRLAEHKRLQMERLEAGEDSTPVPALPAPPPRGGGIEMELVNGQLVPKEQSMVIQTHTEPAYREVTEYTNVINNASYMKRCMGDRWQPEETEMFFQALEQLGTNFELIAKLFPRRDRRSLKNKWRRESKRNPKRVADVLQQRGDPEKLQLIVEALGRASEPGSDDLGIVAEDLFSQRPATADSSQPSADDVPPAVKPRSRGRRSAAAPPEETLNAEALSGSPRRGTSRRKAQPAQSLPADFNASDELPKPGSQKGPRSKRQPKKRNSKKASQPWEDSDPDHISSESSDTGD